jgi:prephenate dehydratase
LGAFATRNVNLTKIESLPTQEKKFEYMFWIDAEKTSLFDDVLEELACFAREIKIL